MVILILVGLVIAAGLWRMSRGPISLAFLESRLVWSLGDDPDALTLAIRNPAMTWGGWRRPVDLTAGPVLVSDHSGRPALELEQISVGLAWLELLKKEIALTRIEVRSIQLHLLRTADGRIVPGFEATERRAPAATSTETDSVLAQRIQDALTSPDPVPHFERLTKVSLVQSSATLDDRVLGVTWNVPNLDLHLRRQRADLHIAADATLDVESHHTALKIDGDLDRDSQRLKATISVTGLHPDALGHVIPALDPLTRVKAPVDLEVTGDLSLDGTLYSADIDLQGRFGSVRGNVGRTDTGGLAAQAILAEIRLSEFASLLPQLAALDMPAHGTVSAVVSADRSVERAAAQIRTDMGQVDGSLEVDESGAATVELELTGFQPWKLEGLVPDLGRLRLPIDAESEVKLTSQRVLRSATLHLTGGTGAIHAPEIHSAPYQIQALTLQASATEALRSITVSDFAVELEGLTVRATGAVAREDGTTRITSSARFTDFGVSSIGQYWPPRLVPDVLSWISANITDGKVNDGSIQVALSLPSAPGGGVRLDQLQGSFEFSGLSVSYLSPMPPAVGLSGRCDFSDRAFHFEVDAGGVEDIDLGSATVAIGPLSGNTRLTVDADGLRGPVAAATGILAGPPLDLMGAGLPRPEQFSGAAVTHLELDVPLSGSDPKPLRISGSSKLTNLGVTGWLKDYDLSDGSLDLGFDLAKLDVGGTAAVNGVAVSFNWHEDLAGGPTPRTIHAHANVNGQDLEALGVPGIRQLEGPMGVTIDVTGRRDGSMDIALDGDLTRTTATVAGLGWSKASGSGGRITANSALFADRSLTVNQFEVSADGLQANGRLATGPGLASLQELVVEGLNVGRTQIGWSLAERPGGGWVIVVRGHRFDVRPVIDTLVRRSREHPNPDHEGQPDLPPLEVNVDIAEIVDGTERTLGRFILRADHDGSLWQRINGNLALTADNVVRVHLAPGMTSGFDLKVTADNAGEVLSTILPRSDVVGGALDIIGHRASENGPLTGHVQLEDYVVTESESLTRILQLASVGGAVDLLSGNGLQFKRLDADFEVFDKVITIKDFRTHGSAIGITADGTVDFGNNVLDVNGSVIPMSRIQSLLGKIPGVGVILSGTKGEGLLAVDYRATGSLSKPELSINPMSGLTPGILRDMFRIPQDAK